MDFDQQFAEIYHEVTTTAERAPINGIKVLILDDLTLAVSTALGSQSDLAADGVAVTQALQKVPRLPPLPHASAIVYVAPIADNISVICNSVLKKGQFQQVFLAFTDFPT